MYTDIFNQALPALDREILAYVGILKDCVTTYGQEKEEIIRTLGTMSWDGAAERGAHHDFHVRLSGMAKVLGISHAELISRIGVAYGEDFSLFGDNMLPRREPGRIGDDELN